MPPNSRVVDQRGRSWSWRPNRGPGNDQQDRPLRALGGGHGLFQRIEDGLFPGRRDARPGPAPSRPSRPPRWPPTARASPDFTVDVLAIRPDEQGGGERPHAVLDADLRPAHCGRPGKMPCWGRSIISKTTFSLGPFKEGLVQVARTLSSRVLRWGTDHLPVEDRRARGGGSRPPGRRAVYVAGSAAGPNRGQRPWKKARIAAEAGARPTREPDRWELRIVQVPPCLPPPNPLLHRVGGVPSRETSERPTAPKG